LSYVEYNNDSIFLSKPDYYTQISNFNDVVCHPEKYIKSSSESGFTQLAVPTLIDNIHFSGGAVEIFIQNLDQFFITKIFVMIQIFLQSIMQFI
jgi:hypothetical protein